MESRSKAADTFVPTAPGEGSVETLPQNKPGKHCIQVGREGTTAAHRTEQLGEQRAEQRNSAGNAAGEPEVSEAAGFSHGEVGAALSLNGSSRVFLLGTGVPVCHHSEVLSCGSSPNFCTRITRDT